MPSREGCRIFLGNLPYSCRERDIERFFDKFGRVRNIFIKQGKYGFCEFDDYRDAEDAVYELNGRDLCGERVTVEHARGPRRDRGYRGGRDYRGGGSGGGGGGGGGDSRGGSGDSRGGGRANWVDKYGPPQRTHYRIIVENLSTRVSWQDLKDLMRRAGEVSFANAHTDRRNEGVVEFVSRRDMERAIDKYDDYELHGRRIKLVRDGSRSRSRSRSPSQSRSKSRSRSYERRSKSRSRDKSGSRDRRSLDRRSNERRSGDRQSSERRSPDRRSTPDRGSPERSSRERDSSLPPNNGRHDESRKRSPSTSPQRDGSPKRKRSDSENDATN